MRVRRNALALGAVPVALALAAFTVPVNLLIFGTATTTTAVAGGDGTDVRTLGPSGNYQGLVEVAWAEDSDIPCWFRVRSRHLNTGSVQTNEVNLGGASCGESSSSLRSVGEAPGSTFINGIAVCRNNQRIKGIAVYYAVVGANGSVTQLQGWDGSDSGYNGNCSAWSPTRYCPSGKVATQLKVYHKSDTPAFSNNIKEAATGIALVCRAVELKS